MVGIKLVIRLELAKHSRHLFRVTAKNTVISLNFLVWKFCGKEQFPHSFGADQNESNVEDQIRMKAV